MNSNRTYLAALDSSNSPTVFFCPAKTVYTWILTETWAFYASIIVKVIASPITMFLNLLVIVAVNKRKELYKNSNILLASMAVADLLVGAVSMPLTVSYDILLLRKDLSRLICRLAFANQIVLYGAVSASFYHLTIIAFERYVAVKMWRNYKFIVTTARVKEWAFMAWLLAVLTAAPARIMAVTKVYDKYVKVVNAISAFKTVVCVALIGYCYIAAYLSVRRRRKGNEVSQVTAFSKAKVENAVAKATGILTTVLLVSYIPSILLLSLGGAIPFFRTSSFFRWSELLLQLNSLLNPILYCFVLNRNFRKEVLKMMKMKKPDERPHLYPAERRRRRNGGTPLVEDVLEIKGKAQQPVFINNATPVNVANPADAACPVPSSVNNKVKIKRSMSCLGKTEGNEFVEHAKELQEEGQQPGLVNNAMSWVAMDRADAVCQMPHRVSSSSCEKNRVICVDVHRPKATRRKLRIQVHDLSLEESQSECR